LKLKDLKKDKKILIVGICAAGKSTLARKLSSELNLPVIHLDQHFWNPGWVVSDEAKWVETIKNLTQKPKWIMEGNYSSTFDIRFPEADTIIVLDFNRYLAMYRAIKRLIKFRGKTRPDMTEGCQERFDLEFMKFVWNFPRDHMPRTDEAIRQFGAGKKIYRFNKPKELQNFLRDNLP